MTTSTRSTLLGLLLVLLFVPAVVAAVGQQAKELPRKYAELVGRYEAEVNGKPVNLVFQELDGKLMAAPEGQTPVECVPWEGKELTFVAYTAQGEVFTLVFGRNDRKDVAKVTATTGQRVVELVRRPLAPGQGVQAPGASHMETPAACLAAARDARAIRARDLTVAGATSAEASRKAEQERLASLEACAARFDPATIAEEDLASLAELYGAISRPELARTALERALARTDASPGEHAALRQQAVLLGLRAPKSDARNARLEAYVDELDRLSVATLDQRFTVHSRMNGYYRGDDIDAGIIKHSSWLIDQGSRLGADDRKKYGGSVVSAFVNLAEARAGQNMTADALALLRRGLQEWSDVPNAARMIEPEIERYMLVGTTAASIIAPRWLNRSDTTPMGLKGKVTLLEFTAHWCGPCRESYPGVLRLRDRFAARGLQVVLVTKLYGYFQSERSLAADVEVERDRAYFGEHHLDLPIAIGDKVDITVEGGKTVYRPAPDANDTAYKVGAIPQIQLIDKRGRIRLIMVGYDDANEEMLARIIGGLLAEK